MEDPFVGSTKRPVVPVRQGESDPGPVVVEEERLPRPRVKDGVRVCPADRVAETRLLNVPPKGAL